jgi:prolyl-tRNA synthetase
MAPCAAGEDEVVLADGYAANIEVASADAAPVELPQAGEAPEAVATPGLTTVAEVAAAFELPEGALLKAYPVMVPGEAGGSERMVVVLVRGDHRVNEVKLALALGVQPRPAGTEEIEAALGPPGFIGPVGAPAEIEILLDSAAARATPGGGFVTGANSLDEHLRGVVPGRDFAYREADVRTVAVGDTVDGVPVAIEQAIEIGNIFKLGTRFSVPLGAGYLDEEGVEQPVWMGSYGIGPARIVAAAIEQNNDEQGIAWPRELAPFAVHLVAVSKPGTPEREAAEQLYRTLREGGIDVLYDDREASPGEKFADAELLGCPLRITVGRRSLESGMAEVQIRRGRRDADGLALDAEPAAIVRAVDELWQTLP